jgi:hypothetical protein
MEPSTRLPHTSLGATFTSTSSWGEAKVTLLRFVQGGGGRGVDVRFMQGSSRLKFVLSSLAPPFDNTGELLPAELCGDVTFSARLETGKGGSEHTLTLGVPLLFSASCSSDGCRTPLSMIRACKRTDIPQLQGSRNQ